MARKVDPKKTLKKPIVRISKSENKKPILGLGTLVTLVLFGLLVLGVLYINRQDESPAADVTPTPGVTYVFEKWEDTVINGIEVKPAEGDAVKVVRSEKGVWEIELPKKAEADQGLAESAASQATALQIVSAIDSAKLDIFGLDKPAYIITIDLEGGEKRVLEVGDATPTNSGYYVRLDKKTTVIVDLSGIDALTQLVTFPPYVSTPTPVATPIP
jgi:hypothetical protein